MMFKNTKAGKELLKSKQLAIMIYFSVVKFCHVMVPRMAATNSRSTKSLETMMMLCGHLRMSLCHDDDDLFFVVF